MAVLLILVGLSLFLAGFSLYLKKAFLINKSWGFKNLIFPPLSILYYLRNWETAKDSGMLQLSGLLILLVGLALWLNSYPENEEINTNNLSGYIEGKTRKTDEKKPAKKLPAEEISASKDQSITSLPGKVTDTVRNTVIEISEVARKEGEDLISIVQKNLDLSGRVNGQRFKPEYITFVNEQLRFKQGENLFGDKEIIFLLPEKNYKLKSGFRLNVQPDSIDGPEVHVSWLEEGKKTPETRIIKSDYSLNLEFQLLKEKEVNASIQFNYEDGEFNSKLAGSFVAFLTDAPKTTLLDEVTQTEKPKLEADNIQLSETAEVNEEKLASTKQPEESSVQKEISTKVEKSIETVKPVATVSEAVNTSETPVQNPETESTENSQTEINITSSTTTTSSTMTNLTDATQPKENEPVRFIPHTDIPEKYVKPETMVILKQLEPYWGKMVVITSVDDATAAGLLKAVRKQQIALEIRVGSGTMEKLIPLSNYKSVKAK